METQQLLYAKIVFDAQFSDLYGNSFEDYFHKIMQYRYPSFIPVRTHGNLGDLSADGLCLHEGKLYACYGPQSPSESDTSKKFRGDLSGAIKKRRSEFDTFVFVHNDRQGLHPKVASEMAAAQKDYPSLNFEQMGKQLIWREFMKLELIDAQDLLGQPIRVEPLVYGISLADLAPLLNHLQRLRDREAAPYVVPMNKLDHNRLDETIRHYITYGMRFAKQIDTYYDQENYTLQRDEHSAAFNERYLTLRAIGQSPDEIFQDLLVYVVGNKLPDARTLTSAYAVLSYFFNRCDIFERPPNEAVQVASGALT